MNNKNEELFNRMSNNKINKRSLGISLKGKRKINLGQEINFTKSINTLILNINGEKPLIIYKKSPNKNRKIEIKQNNYMSDGGMKKKNKRFFNLISNYSNKKEKINNLVKEKNSSSGIKNKKYKSFSFSIKKEKKKKNNYFESEIKDSNLIKNKSKGDFKYNLFLKKQQNNSYGKNISNQNENNNRKLNNNKNILINNLINEKHYEPKFPKNQVQKFFFMGKKLEYLKANNIDISKSESNLEKDNDENIGKQNDNNKMKNKNIVKAKIDFDKNSLTNSKQKPIIDQFEYIKKINIIHHKSTKNPRAKNIFKYYNLIKTENEATPKNLNINTNKNNIINSNDDVNSDDGLFFSHHKKKNKEELKIFTKKRNRKENKQKEEDETEKSKKIYKKFKNLYKLNLENINFMNQQNIRRTLNIKSQTNEQFRKRRVKNSYYIGKDGNKNDSTFIEPKDYYLTLYQSRQLITNSNLTIDININNNQYINEEEKKKKKQYKYNNMKNFINKLKSYVKRKAFTDLYYIYFKNRYNNHYYLSFKFFIAIIKQYAFKKLCLYCIFKKKNSNENKKIKYLVEFLSLIFKMKVLEKIFNYGQQKEIRIFKQNLETIIKVIKKALLNKVFKKIKKFNKRIDKKVKIIKEENNKENNDEINDELNENENIINNNFNIIYAEGLKNIIEEINNSEQDYKILKKTEDKLKYDEIKRETKVNQIKHDTNINYINIIINNNIKNVLNENDFSEEKHINKGRFLDYVHEEKDEKIIINNKSKNKKNKTESDDLFEEIKQMKSYSECSGLANESKSSNNINEINIVKTKVNKINTNVNISLKKETKVINYIKEKEAIKKDNITDNLNQVKNILKISNIDNFVDVITESLIKYICDDEIINKEKLLPNKSNNYFPHFDSLKENQNSISICNIQNDDSRYKDLNSLGIGYQVIKDSNTFLDKSLVFSSSTYSFFNKTIFEKKKVLKDNFFLEKIFPRLIKLIKQELSGKYKAIFIYITSPIKINIKDFIVSLIIKDKESIINDYKDELFKENIDEIISKKIILNKLNKVTNEIREKYFLDNDFFYDKILNECILDQVIEVIKKEKLLFNIERNKLFLYEQKNIIDNPSINILKDKKKFVDNICKSLVSLLGIKIGKKINELNIINEDKIKEQNELKLNNEIKKELIGEDKENVNLIKIEENLIKLNIAENIFDILVKETAIILENIQNSRIKFGSVYNEKFCLNEDIMDILDNKNKNDYYGDCDDDLINY